MRLTEREQEIIALLRREPTITPAEIADRLGSSRAAVNVHLSNLGKKGAILGRGYIVREERSAAVVVGGANLDIKARSAKPVVRRTSNPGFGRMGAGGVGRNIAENLARLGTPTHLVAGVGRDAMGDRVVAETRAAGVHLEHLHRSDDDPTGTYTAVMDHDGELVLAIADMSVTDHLLPHHVEPARDLIANAGLLVLDGNLPWDTLAHALDLGGAAGIRCVLDPVSVPKARTLAPIVDEHRPLFAITPNRDELQSLTGSPTRTDRQLLRSAETLHDRGVRHVWVRLGDRGSLFSTVDEDPVFLPALDVEVADVTGAGDAMLAAFAHYLLDGREPVDAARYGHAAAAATVAVPHTVRPDLSSRLLERLLSGTGATAAPKQQRPDLEGTSR